MSEMDGVWDLEMETIRGNRTARLSLKTDGATAAGSLTGDKRTLRVRQRQGQGQRGPVGVERDAAADPA